MNKIRLAVLGLFGVGAAGFAGYTYMNGSGEIHVKAPATTGVTVDIDGKTVATIAAGTHQKLEITQGKHAIKIKQDEGKAEASHDFEVESGFYEGVVPGPEQCFVDFDVYETFYGKADPPELPKVVGTHAADEPFDISGHHYFSEEALPNEIKEGTSVNLLEEIPCKLVSASHDELREATGFTQDSLKRTQ